MLERLQIIIISNDEKDHPENQALVMAAFVLCTVAVLCVFLSALKQRWLQRLAKPKASVYQ